MKKIFLITGALLLLFSCSQSQGDFTKSENQRSAPVSEAAESEMKKLSKEAGPGSANFNSTKIESRKLIWSADIRFQVKNVDQSSERISSLCEKYGGFISDMQLTNDTYQVTNRITLRVTNDKFHKLVRDLKGESVFMDRANVNSNDVTEEFVDIESRLKTKREVRDRYVEILRNKTGDINDVISAEEAIRAITEEIEAKEGRLRYLQNRVDYSTIDVEIYQKVKHQPKPEVYEESYSDKAKDSFKSGWAFIKALVLGLITIWPLLLIVGIVVYIKRKWLRKVFGKKKE